MSKDFYSVLAQELCSIKNSPFSLLSKNDNPNMGSSHILKSQRLSYDPDRFFNQDKNKNSKSDDPTYLQIEREQKQQLQRIQISLLKEKTHQELLKLKQTTELFNGYRFNHPYSIFKVNRTTCLNCSKCYEYNGNFNIGLTGKLPGLQKQVEYLCCLTCACPMNSHQSITSKNKFSSEIFNYLSTCSIQDSQLNNKCFPICFSKAKSLSLPTILSNFYNYLPQLGFQIVSYKIMSRKNFELFMIKKQILSGIQKQTVQRLMNFVSFLQHQEDWNWDQNLPQDIDQNYFQIVKKLRNGLRLSISKQDQVIVFFTKNINNFQHLQLVTLMNHYSKMFSAQFVWTPKQVKETFLTSCLLFPQHFKVNHQIFVLPSQLTDHEMDFVASRFKDLLDYNNYITIGQIKTIQTAKLEKILQSQNSNQLNYIMGQDQVNDVLKRIRILLSAKVGPAIFTIPFKNAVDFIEISSEQKKAAFMMAFPEYLRSQRCVIVLRPCFTLSNFNEVIMTLLRVNNFVLLKRRHVILSNQQAQYLATLQKIEAKDLDAYIKMMTSGASQIVLVSKRGAIYEANILLNGSKDSLSDTKVKVIKDIPTMKKKQGTQSYEYQPFVKPFETERKQCFSSINQLFKVQTILFPQQIKEIKFMTNEKNGAVIKIDSQNKVLQQFQASSKTKESILTEIKKDTFNYWAYSSKSEFLTEELAGVFMPETTLFDSCVVVVKPGFVHLTDKIKQALMEHRYHIIMEKTVLLSQKLAYELILNLRKTSTSTNDLKKYVQVYSQENIHIFCISKVFAKQEMLSILSNFSFLSPMSTIVTDYVDDSLLKEILVPVWNNQQFVLRILSAPLYNIQQAVNRLYAPDISNQDKLQILRYMLGSYYGVKIEDLSLKSIIGKFSYYITTSYVANLQSWFYSEISKLNARYVPTLFQHRLIGETCFVIQSDFGYPFLNRISLQYDDEQKNINELSIKDNRKSLILFLWTKQLAKFVHNVSQKSPNMKGWGRLAKINDQWQGKTLQRQMHEMEKEFLQNWYQKFENSEWQINMHIKKILDSRFLAQKYRDQSKKKLIPYFIEGKIDECIRIIETQEIAKLHLVDKYSMIDPQHEKSNEKSLYTLTLYNVEPSIGTKQQLIVEIMVFLIRLENTNQEYKQMFKLLFQYFVQHVLEYSEADVVECQLYIRLLKEYTMTSEEWIKTRLRTYPNLKKIVASNNASVNNDEISGKKRKFLQKRQYYKDQHSNLTEQQRHIKNKQYKNFNLNYEALQNEKDFDKNNPLLNMKDPFHRKITLQQRPISLLREEPQSKKQKTGIYVEFQKKITQNQELLMNKVKGQVDKFNLKREDKILYETGLQNELWYRKTKGEKVTDKKSQVNDAIQKQLLKLKQFKSKEENNKEDSQFYQTR